MQGQFKFFFEESKCACGLLIECGYIQDLRYNTDYTKMDMEWGFESSLRQSYILANLMYPVR